MVQAHPPAVAWVKSWEDMDVSTLAGPYRPIRPASCHAALHLDLLMSTGYINGGTREGASCKGPGQTGRVAEHRPVMRFNSSCWPAISVFGIGAVGLQLVAWARRRETSCAGREQAAFSWPLPEPQCVSKQHLVGHCRTSSSLEGDTHTPVC